MPAYRRYHLQGRTVFVTVVTQARRPWLVDDGAELLLASMRRVKTLNPFRHCAHVVMPDHFHWMFEPHDGDFSTILGSVKRDVSWQLRWRRGPACRWQSRFHDHVIRDDADFRRHLDYLHFNPVHHGLAASPDEYPHSSFAAWVERGLYTRDWGAQAPDTIRGMLIE